MNSFESKHHSPRTHEPLSPSCCPSLCLLSWCVHSSKEALACLSSHNLPPRISSPLARPWQTLLLKIMIRWLVGTALSSIYLAVLCFFAARTPSSIPHRCRSSKSAPISFARNSRPTSLEGEGRRGRYRLVVIRRPWRSHLLTCATDPRNRVACAILANVGHTDSQMNQNRPAGW